MAGAATEPAGAGGRIAEAFADPSVGARRIDVKEPTVLFEPATPPDNLYLIQSGQVRMYQVGPDKSARLADILGPGDWFGTAALAGAELYGARADVVPPSIIWAMPVTRLLRLLGEQPRVSVELIGQLAGRLQAAYEAAARLVFDDCNQRLIQTLLKFSRTAAATPQDNGGVVLHITHQELAHAVGAARETVSLALTQLRQRNLLRTGRNRLLFDPQVLEEFSRRQLEKTGEEPQ